jgi:hypothetical protein
MICFRPYSFVGVSARPLKICSSCVSKANFKKAGYHKNLFFSRTLKRAGTFEK